MFVRIFFLTELITICFQYKVDLITYKYLLELNWMFWVTVISLIVCLASFGWFVLLLLFVSLVL